MEDLNQHFQNSDVIKALIALLAGILLGYERESKDKSAGLKTISIITVGSALFSILSQNYSGTGDSFSIAAGIISGIGFLGAGVIFKEGFTIYGLTTAGIIWVSAAVGMSIGFGEFYIAGVFLGVTLLVIYGTQLIGKYFIPNNSTKGLQIIMRMEDSEKRNDLIREIGKFTKYQYITRVEKSEDSHLIIDMDIHIRQQNIDDLQEFLFKYPTVLSFSL